MRDIQQVLSRWGAWVVNNHESVAWSTVAAGFKGQIPPKIKSRPQCSDDDAMIICDCMAQLNRNNSDLHDFLLDYYVFGMTLIALGRKYGRSDCWAGRILQKAEGVIDGMLMMQGIKLEMDRYVEREPSGTSTDQFAGQTEN
ncbi:antitermination protein [Escherichia coli]|nr:antitermination protein [Escherichia coli]EHP9641242.1 antitermination protein [Escherichia coli]EHP9665601.1 antitermination protein [Escherichia coli]EHP9692178.1 antitermination protein [Escherichia coli]EHP9864078.1 antitermination protein [Escherichia coli]